jgi:hypothetical protein
MRRLPPAKARDAIRRQLESEEGVEGCRRGISVEAVLVMVRMGLGPGMCPVGVHRSVLRCENVDVESVVLERKPPPLRQPRKATSGAGQELCGRPSKRAQALVREQLANGPRRGEDVQAAAHLADISERSLSRPRVRSGSTPGRGSGGCRRHLPARAGRVAAAIACAAGADRLAAGRRFDSTHRLAGFGCSVVAPVLPQPTIGATTYHNYRCLLIFSRWVLGTIN